ncbi:ClC family H(+)/Cl(-) exchange transporter [Vagococcus fluvialis]|uniref:ClC family H(+)/Cl(-) exchange transporter n=2 Tax=Vagococcus fluvialis TaxID=2738 RepID=A0A369AZQ5_9ENTE|nr:ClC family H(+)/Cl(-) exchange transporter [Vagococcus fluvialis]MBO0442771.1 ClC family H(+)/Cl(-) exchange transporter [Vagococcus fluvialis]MBO0478189.1 ClC family H(+)/Cl(-) exchange transporter [Vagococcus fluvialis]MBO0483600.1 ClC family H(+)/Cl(-) exchange transporter [Vagococcus fluvialis]MDT2745930.1 ClC family H(+)/Cl(-) exchange transporter [Vagococcus fluvialis]MDT2782005.1 ClC family H(+)/Cl(-) exchange transporter [Vagococcus fluvialis]
MKYYDDIRKLDGTKILFIGKGVLIGLAVGLVVSLFRLAIGFVSHHLDTIYYYLKQHPIAILGWILISLMVAYILGRLIKSDPNIKGSGIPQVEGQLRGQLSINWWSVLWKKFVGGILALGMGLFLGREGPSIQLGAVVAQGIGEHTKTTNAEKKILISSGASAGLSAAFNAPIAGLLFILEEVHHSFSPLVLLTAFSATITSNFVSMHFFGLQPTLYIGELETLPLKYYWTLIILGILIGTLAIGYQQVLLYSSKIFQKIPKLPSYFYGVIPILLVIPIGLFLPSLLGGGHDIIIQLTTNNFSILILITLFIFRFLFSMISYGSGLPGGIFLPILSLGAIIGVLFGTILTQTIGIDSIYIKSFLILAMAGYFSAISKAPLTGMILITEMVGSFSHLMSIGVVVLISYITVDFLKGKPIYESLLENLVTSDEEDIKGSKTIIEFPIIVESLFDEQMVRDINWPSHMLLTSIRRGESEFIPHGDTLIHCGDVLIILTDEGLAESLKQDLIMRSHSS